MNFREPNLHVVACVVAIIVGVLAYANVLHVATEHAGTGLVLVALGILMLV